MLTRLLRANSVQSIVAGRARYVPMAETRDKIPLLFESLRPSEQVCRRDKRRRTRSPSRARPDRCG